jgi:anti-sigma regulatory factor (Ser/Thr protein kinase)
MISAYPERVHRAGNPAPSTMPGTAGWAQTALAVLSDLPGVCRVGLALDEGAGRRLRFTASDRDGRATTPWCHIDAWDDLPRNTAVRTAELVTGSLEELAGRYPDFVDRQSGTSARAVAAVPLPASGRVLGGFVLFFDEPQLFDAAHRRELALTGVELGAALWRAQLGERRPTTGLPQVATPPGAQVAVHAVAPQPASVGEARRFLRGVLDGWGIDQDVTDTAVLCVSELVTNAVIHSHTDCSVRTVLEQDVLTTTVHDHGLREAASAEALDDPLRVHGRGLQLVEALAARWGYELDADGTTVWFVLDL